jgi:antitoxin component YwqK of YwqJK toxin-antitoxin module
MQTFIRYTFLLFLAGSLMTKSFSQAINQKDSNGKKTGLWKTYYANDSVKSKGFYKADKAIGLWEYYYDTGQLMAYMEHLTDGITINFKLFDPSGPRIGEGLYVNKKKEGKWLYYSIDSSKVFDEVYVKGLKEGEERVYYPKTGSLFQATLYKGNKKNGYWKQFYPNGVLKTDATFINDTLQGKAIYYHETGKKQMEGKYVNALRDGEFFIYDEQGKLIDTLHYKKGILDEKDKLRLMKKDDNSKTYPEDIIYQGGYEQYNPNNGNGGY